jgi:hypothetical protein
MNNYRNTHFQSLNAAKKNFKAMIADQLQAAPRFKGKVRIEYKLFPATKRLCDLDNVMAVQKKFGQDAMVEFGVIEEDTYDILVSNKEEFGEIDRENPRVEATVISC